jgi:urease accessory protein
MIFPRTSAEGNGLEDRVLRVESIAGHLDDPAIAVELGRLRRRGAIEYLVLGQADSQRRRLRATSDVGTDCAIALPRNERLEDGSVLFIDEHRAIVVRIDAVSWLTVKPASLASAIELGHLAGSMHWRVKFDGERLKIAIEGDEGAYRDRIAPLLEKHMAVLVDVD